MEAVLHAGADPGPVDDLRSRGEAVKVCCISDTHTYHADLALGEGDLLIHSGDFTMRGTREEIDQFSDWLGAQQYAHKIVVAGNHELTLDSHRFETRLRKFANKPAQLESLRRSCDPALFRQRIEGAGAVYLEHSSTTCMGYEVFGTPYVPPCGDWAFCKAQTERERLFAAIPSSADILVTHTPPHGVLDACAMKRTGCAALLSRVRECRPLLHCFGHIHAGYGVLRSEGTTFVNAAVCDEDYAATQQPIFVALRRRDADTP